MALFNLHHYMDVTVLRELCLKAHAVIGGQIAPLPDSVRFLPSHLPQQELLQPAPAPGRADILVYYSILSADIHP